MTAVDRVPCTVVTGFLGAGKTTLIRNVLENANGKRLAIIVNEFGDVGIDGVLFLGDCGVLPEPSAEQLADIAITTATLAHHLTNTTPRVALLSFSTKSSAAHPSLDRVRAAAELARAKARTLTTPMAIDGEMQVGAVIPDKKIVGRG